MSDQPDSDDAKIWLASPEGLAWSRSLFRPVEDQEGIFGAIRPQPWGKPWRPHADARARHLAAERVRERVAWRLIKESWGLS